jgi:hypothetical protein
MMQVYFNLTIIHAVVLLSKKIPFVLLLLLPSFARTAQVSTQIFMICSTAACVLTTVLTLYLLPDNSDFGFIGTVQAAVEMLYVKETVFGVRDAAPLMDSKHPSLAALAAA